jgi:peptide/nickel transport system substrate-binding protein
MIKNICQTGLLVFLVATLISHFNISFANDRPNLVVAVTDNPKKLDPMGENTNVNGRISNNVLEKLIDVDYKNNSQLIPGLAESWKVLDAQTIEFKLRQDVKCHNGEEFDAEDVAFSFGPERFMGENAPGWAIAKAFLGDIVSVEAIDKYTVQIKSQIPDPLLEQRFANFMSECVCKDAYLAAGSWKIGPKRPWAQVLTGLPNSNQANIYGLRLSMITGVKRHRPRV